MSNGTRVGFVGLGDMGGAIAHRIIAAGFHTTLWARNEKPLEPYRNTSDCIYACIDKLKEELENLVQRRFD